MELLHELIWASACKSTHHKLGLLAVRELRVDHVSRWQRLFYYHYERFLLGCKDPDDKFKDFKNHVLHVEQNYWGGAPATALRWYDKTILALQTESWSDAIYAAGVLSHYLSDPLMPLHTGQTGAEGQVHRPAEWSITCSFDQIWQIVETEIGLTTIKLNNKPTWLADALKQQADYAHQFYEPLVSEYLLEAGVKEPTAGLTPSLQRQMAQCLSRAVGLFVAVLERAIQQAAVTPPPVFLGLETILAGIKVPLRWITQKIHAADQREQIERIYAEFQSTGKVVENLPEDEKVVAELMQTEAPRPVIKSKTLPIARPEKTPPVTQSTPRVETNSKPSLNKIVAPPVVEELVAEDESEDDTPIAEPVRPAPRQQIVAQVPAANLQTNIEQSRPAPVKARMPEPEPKPAVTPQRVDRAESKPAAHALKFFLELDSPVADAPTIGNKTAERFHAIGVKTVRQLLELDPQQAANQLKIKWLDAATITDIQHQARLVCQVPQLRGHDAQMLVACQITEPEQLVLADAEALLEELDNFLQTSAGQRILRSSPAPDHAEVTDWIAWAGQARELAVN